MAREAKKKDVIFTNSSNFLEIVQKRDYNPKNMMNLFKIPLTFVLTAALVWPAFGLNADEETDWVEGDFSKTRLVASHKNVPDDEEAPLYLGWQVQMEGDWKTYWRTPGSAGLPPVFSWAGSVNIANVEVLYPLPSRFQLFDLQTYGYHNEVVYPIKITPAIAGAPITVKMKVNFLVCEDLCVPVEDAFEMTIPATEGKAVFSIHAGLIDRYLEQVPESVSGMGKEIQIANVSLSGVPGSQNLILRLIGTALLSGADVIVEDTVNFKFGAPRKRLQASGTEAEFIVPVRAEQADGTLSGQTLTVIIIDGWGNMEEIQLNITNQ